MPRAVAKQASKQKKREHGKEVHNLWYAYMDRTMALIL